MRIYINAQGTGDYTRSEDALKEKGGCVGVFHLAGIGVNLTKRDQLPLLGPVRQKVKGNCLLSTFLWPR
uniref:HDC13644 n=1 Tax=Drosophila melanogaster TaxID=7227 RepID=Q6IK15_DROME|nr:TPA_inf: HDC13644 [Drosophila melanogaster]